MACRSCGILLAILTLIGCQRSGSSEPDHPSSHPAITFNEIAPILYEHCAPCHRQGQLAPFPLLTYADAGLHVRQIANLTKSRAMPPWLPEPGYGEFRNERRLSSKQIDLIQEWVAQGALEGDVRKLPAPPQWQDEWQLGRPDLVVTMPRSYTLRAGGPGSNDVFRNFVIPLRLDATKYIKGVELRPANPKLVHHAVISLDPTPASRRMDDADPEPGYDGMLHGSRAATPDERFLGWTPGKMPTMEPEGMAWRLERGSDLVVQLHMLPAAKPEPVQFQIGFFFTDTPPVRVPFLILMGSETVDIPAGKKDYSITDSYVLPAEVEAISIYPHAHYLAKEMKASATLPDGAVKWLLWIKNWDFYWQDVYTYAKPVVLPQGTTIRMEYVYDNSPDNVRNPNVPPRRVVQGPHSSDEMADLWIQVVPRDAGDIAALERVRRERELNTEIAVSEKQLTEDPRNADEHNFLGARYVAARRPQDAVKHLEESLRLNPRNAAAHTNLGNAFQLEGRLADAVAEFRQAIAVDPRSAEAHNNLGVILIGQNQLDEAILHFRRAVESAPGYGEAHASLGVALALRGRADEAVVHLRRALEINPDDAGARDSLNRLEASRRH